MIIVSEGLLNKINVDNNFELMENMTRLDKDNMHITLISRDTFSDLNLREKFLGVSDYKLTAPKLLMSSIIKVDRPIKGRSSMAVILENQDEWRTYVDDICNKVGIENPEKDRLFHFTIANNKNGDPNQSVGDINICDLN